MKSCVIRILPVFLRDQLLGVNEYFHTNDDDGTCCCWPMMMMVLVVVDVVDVVDDDGDNNEVDDCHTDSGSSNIYNIETSTFYLFTYCLLACLSVIGHTRPSIKLLYL